MKTPEKKEPTKTLKMSNVRRLYRNRKTLLEAKMQIRELWRKVQKVV